MIPSGGNAREFGFPICLSHRLFMVTGPLRAMCFKLSLGSASFSIPPLTWLGVSAVCSDGVEDRKAALPVWSSKTGRKWLLW
jgi:hypothetical protein